MKILVGFGLSILAYSATAILIFGDIFAPVAFVTMFSDRLGTPLWGLRVLVSAAIAAASAVFLSRYCGLAARFGVPVFISISMVLSVVSVGAHAERIRGQKVEEFGPDAYIEQPFRRSIREAPRDFQFFLHGAALKDCKPYAWSYRQMTFYELPPNVAVNVLPYEWVERCKIQRSR